MCKLLTDTSAFLHLPALHLTPSCAPVVAVLSVLVAQNIYTYLYTKINAKCTGNGKREEHHDSKDGCYNSKNDDNDSVCSIYIVTCLYLQQHTP